MSQVINVSQIQSQEAVSGLMYRGSRYQAVQPSVGRSVVAVVEPSTQRLMYRGTNYEMVSFLLPQLQEQGRLRYRGISYFRKNSIQIQSYQRQIATAAA